MTFSQKTLLTDAMGQKISVQCLVLSEPDTEGNVWVHLDASRPYIMEACLQLVSQTNLT